MNILGIIVEYNPFHNGHLFHLEQAKKLANADYVIAVMSGNFMQRGVPAFLDKWSRTKMALSCGVDMVIELPVTHASTSAENFAFGAISILENLKIVDSVCFGSELGNIETLKELSNILSNEPNSFKKHLKEHLDLGLTFPKARSNALYKYITENNLFSISNEHLENILNSPNNILGIEYLKALNKLHSNIVPYTITRKTAGYHDVEIHDSISSATAIRNSVDNLDLIKSSMPDAAFEILKEDLNIGKGPIEFDDFSQALHYKLESSKDLSIYLDVIEGIENRILKSSKENYLVSDILEDIQTKRYTNTHLQRTLLHILLGITKKDIYCFNRHGGPQYARVLGFKKESDVLFSLINKNSKLPIISNVGASYKKLNNLAQKMFDIEVFSTNIYSLAYPSIENRKTNLEFINQIIKM